MWGISVPLTLVAPIGIGAGILAFAFGGWGSAIAVGVAAIVGTIVLSGLFVGKVANADSSGPEQNHGHDHNPANTHAQRDPARTSDNSTHS